MSKKALDELGVAIANAGYAWTSEMREAYEKGIRKSEWVGLTDKEIDDWVPGLQAVVRAVETKLKEKNT